MEEDAEKNRLLLPALFVAIYANWTPLVISGLLLIEIAESFNAPVGITGQMSTLSSTLAILGAIITGLISSTYRPRKILLAGLILHLINDLNPSRRTYPDRRKASCYGVNHFSCYSDIHLRFTSCRFP
jgi:predicted MFS family arabinose efflux permease